MSELYLPLDYEQLSEFWQLRAALQGTPSPTPLHPKQIDQAATFLLLRLFVTLGYLARSTNRPGLLSRTGAEQFAASLDPLYGSPATGAAPNLPVEILVKVGLLVPEPEAGWFCPMFAGLNAHLAGNFKRACDKGNLRSRMSAALKKLNEVVGTQAHLFPPEIFKRQDGVAMDETEAKRSMVCIQMLDRALGVMRMRTKAEFTEGVMASACAATKLHDSAELFRFYNWLHENKEHPALPKVAEDVLKDFEKYFQMMG